RAADCIRVFHVTGVQTCALLIFRSRSSGRARSTSCSSWTRRSSCPGTESPSIALSSPGSATGSALDRLDLEEFLQAELAVLAAVAGLLVATERRQRVERAAVDVDL